MIIALPEKDHGHLADALVRDLGFTRTHVDAPLRELLLALDPFVDSGVTLANMGPSPRLSSKLDQAGGGEAGWDRLLHPSRPGSAPDRTATEVKRLLDVRRRELGDDYGARADNEGDVVVMGEAVACHEFVAIAGRYEGSGVDHVIDPAGVVGEQEAIIAYVKKLRGPKPMSGQLLESLPSSPLEAYAVSDGLVKGDNEYIEDTRSHLDRASVDD